MGKSRNPQPAPNPALERQTQIAEQLFAETSPLRRELIGDSTSFLAGDRDVTQTPAFAAIKDAIESQFGRARENIIATTPEGGGLQTSLGDLDRGRASTLVQSIAPLQEAELQRALLLGTGSTSPVLSALGGAGAIQAQEGIAAQNRQSQKAGATGGAVGRVAAATIGKGGPAGAAAGAK